MKKGQSPRCVFGRGLRRLREERSLTQEKLAELAEIDRTYVYRLESGKRSPSLEILLRISDAFEITPGELLTKAFTTR